MNHNELMKDSVYANWSESRQQDYRCICMAAYYYAQIVFEPGAIMDHLCAIMCCQTNYSSLKAREDMAKEILAISIPEKHKEPESIENQTFEYNDTVLIKESCDIEAVSGKIGIVVSSIVLPEDKIVRVSVAGISSPYIDGNWIINVGDLENYNNKKINGFFVGCKVKVKQADWNKRTIGCTGEVVDFLNERDSLNRRRLKVRLYNKASYRKDECFLFDQGELEVI